MCFGAFLLPYEWAVHVVRTARLRIEESMALISIRSDCNTPAVACATDGYGNAAA